MKKIILILSVIAVMVACSSSDDSGYDIKETKWVSDKFNKGDSVIYYRIDFTKYNSLMLVRTATKDGWVKSSANGYVAYSFVDDLLTFKHSDYDMSFYRNGETLILNKGFPECPNIFYRSE